MRPSAKLSVKPTNWWHSLKRFRRARSQRAFRRLRTRTKYGYDAAGNTKTYSNIAFTYNDRGRPSSVTVGTAVTNYVYSALGQLIKKSWGSAGVLLVYDEAGHLLGEYSVTGALIQETVWMGDIPVATLQPSGSGIAIYYVHTDQLNAPRKITRPSDNGLMWRWDADPFGTRWANQNPAGLGNFVYNLRFPGQYFQVGTNQNGFRDYDSNTGRYIESDPIGLQGGVNTYAYAAANPISRKDPLGLKVSITGISPASQAALQNAYDTIGNTMAGKLLEMALEDSPVEYLITDLFGDRYPANYLYWNNIISIDPNFHPTSIVRNGCGEMEAQPTPTDVILGHELGHALAYPYNEGPSPDNMDVVNQFENPIRQELGLPPRIMYGLPRAYQLGR
jgi:RHS repeat-associated protein